MPVSDTSVDYVVTKPKRPRLTRGDHWRLFWRDLRLAWWHLLVVMRGR